MGFGKNVKPPCIHGLANSPRFTVTSHAQSAGWMDASALWLWDRRAVCEHATRTHARVHARPRERRPGSLGEAKRTDCPHAAALPNCPLSDLQQDKVSACHKCTSAPSDVHVHVECSVCSAWISPTWPVSLGFRHSSEKGQFSSGVRSSVNLWLVARHCTLLYSMSCLELC